MHSWRTNGYEVGDTHSHTNVSELKVREPDLGCPTLNVTLAFYELFTSRRPQISRQAYEVSVVHRQSNMSVVALLICLVGWTHHAPDSPVLSIALSPVESAFHLAVPCIQSSYMNHVRRIILLCQSTKWRTSEAIQSVCLFEEDDQQTLSLTVPEKNLCRLGHLYPIRSQIRVGAKEWSAENSFQTPGRIGASRPESIS